MFQRTFVLFPMLSVMLFAYIAGCNSSDMSRSLPTGTDIGQWEFPEEIDGVRYCFNGFSTYLQHIKAEGTIIVVHCQSEKPIPVGVFGYQHGESDRLSGYICIGTDGSIHIPVDYDCIYYVENGAIRFGKTLEELGIDPADRMRLDHEYLQPILETLIRENLPKDE